MNINPRIAKSLKNYYTAKRLEGQLLTREEMKLNFNEKTRWNYPDVFCSPTTMPDQTMFRVKKCNLVVREYALSLLERLPIKGLWQITPRLITGTCLYIYFDNDPVSFWKLPKYGRESDYLPNDIEECHISTRVKNRQRVVLFLKMLKKQNAHKPVQSQLFD